MALTTSKKHDNFVKETMYRNGDPKEIDEVAGIGAKAKKELTEKGFEYAHMLLGQFLLFNQDEEMFMEFLKENAPCLNSKHRQDCFNCFKEWCRANL